MFLDGMIADIIINCSAFGFLVNSIFYATVVHGYLSFLAFLNNLLTIFMLPFCPAF
jgi:hypothetical protein